MDPLDFRDKWQLNNAEIALLVGAPVGTVNHWMSDRDPPQNIKVLLAHIDAVWQCWAIQESALQPQMRELYQVAVKRRSQ